MQLSGLLATVLVVMIHYRTVQPGQANLYTINYLIQEYLCNGVGRAAVPLFAWQSGLFFFMNFGGLADYPKKIRQRAVTLLVPYLLVSLFCLLFELTQTRYAGQSLPSYRYLAVSWLLHPRTTQLWYLRDLMVLVSLTPLIHGLLRYTRWVAVIAVGSCWLFEQQFFPEVADWYLINVETLFFFVLGGAMANRVADIDRWHRVDKVWLFAWLGLWLTLIGLRVYIDPTFDVWYVRHFSLASLLLQKLSILVGVVVILVVAARLQAKILVTLSSFSFFVFLFHSYPLSRLVKWLSEQMVDPERVFYPATALSLLGSFGLALVANRFFPKSYGWLTGGRSREKIHDRQTRLPES